MDDISYSLNFSSYILRRPQICGKILVTLKEAGIFRQIFVAFSEYMNFKIVHDATLHIFEEQITSIH